MLFNKILSKHKISGVLATLFIFAWFFCSVHITVSQDHSQVSTVPDTRQSPSPHEESSVKLCLDHTPSQTITRLQNDVSNSPVLISNTTNEVIEQIQKSNNIRRDYFRDDDHLSMRYSFLIHNKFLI